MLKKLNLDLDLQTIFKVTRQKQRLVDLIEKTPNTTIMKKEDERSKSRSSPT
jgi:hypothetical protein